MTLRFLQQLDIGSGDGVADSGYEPSSVSTEDSFKVLQNHTAIQQRPEIIHLRHSFSSI